MYVKSYKASLKKKERHITMLPVHKLLFSVAENIILGEKLAPQSFLVAEVQTLV